MHVLTCSHGSIIQRYAVSIFTHVLSFMPSHSHPHKRTQYTTKSHFFCPLVIRFISLTTGHLDHLYRGAKLRGCLSWSTWAGSSKPETPTATFLLSTHTKSSAESHTHLSSSHSRFIHTGFTPPTWFISSHPLCYSFFLPSHLLSFSLSRAVQTCPTSTATNPPSPAAMLTLGQLAGSHHLSPAPYPSLPLCLSHTCWVSVE